MATERFHLSRRSVLHGAAMTGTGLFVSVHFSRADVLAAPARSPAGSFAPDAVIRIARDGRATLIMFQVEMGQGTYTSIPMIIAEELDLELSNVTIEAAPPNDALYGNPIFRIQMTGGSTSIRAYWMPMRQAGARAREMLVAAAANIWAVPPVQCRTRDGAVHHEATDRTLPYGALVDRASGIALPSHPALKSPSEFRLIGRPLPRLDTPNKTNGTAKYGIDAMPDGLKFATLASCPVFGGKLASVDTSAALALPGVRQVVVLDNLVAVVGDHMWAAKQGLDALDIRWQDGPNATLSSAEIWAALATAALAEGVVAQKVGDPLSHLSGSDIIEATYDLPFLAHAAMEPMNCTVHVTADSCEVWVGTQVMTKAQQAAATQSGLRIDQVVIHNHLIGGGFGRRLETDGIATAVRIAMHVESPVKVIWTREEDIQQAMYRPVYRNRMVARLIDGKPVSVRHRIVGASILARFLPPAFVGGLDADATDGAIDQPYDFPNLQIEYTRFEPQGIPTCFWRGVGANNNIFAAECFMDRLARETGADPVAFRRELLGKSPRALAVLEIAALQAGWGTSLGTGRRGRGICVQSAFGSFLAVVAEVSVGVDGEVKVDRVVCAVDCGIIVNPDTVIAQIQGGMIFGLTAILHGQITIANGRVQQSNYHDYRMMRMNEVPRIEVHLITSGEAPGGIGEPGTVAVQPAVANAVYAATGTQLSRMPIERALLRAQLT